MKPYKRALGRRYSWTTFVSGLRWRVLFQWHFSVETSCVFFFVTTTRRFSSANRVAPWMWSNCQIPPTVRQDVCLRRPGRLYLRAQRLLMSPKVKTPLGKPRFLFVTLSGSIKADDTTRASVLYHGVSMTCNWI